MNYLTEDMIKTETFDCYNFYQKEEPDIYQDAYNKTSNDPLVPCVSSIESDFYPKSDRSHHPSLPASELDGAVWQSNVCQMRIKQEPVYGESDLLEADYRNSCSKNSNQIKEELLLKNEYVFENHSDVSCSDVTLYCYYCHFASKYRGNLIRHIKLKHMLVERPKKFKCSLCDYKFLHRYELKRHEIKHARIHIFFCHFCGYGCDKRSRIFEHIFRKHAFDLPVGNFDEPTVCFTCNYRTVIKSELLQHFLDCHERSIKKNKLYGSYHKCELCSYGSFCKSTLISHIDAVHKKIRPYICHLCPYAANKPTSLRIHISAIHDRVTPFKCHICSYASAYKKHLRRHILSQHTKNKKRKDIKK